MYGNPTFWSLPVAAVTLGAEAGVFIVAYDMLTQPRIALGVKLLRTRAPVEQSRSSALADYAPAAAAVAGLLFGLLVHAPPVVASIVTGLGIAMSLVAALLLGVAWPREWIGRCSAKLSLRGLALHLTFVPAVLGVATLLGLDLPGAASDPRLRPAAGLDRRLRAPVRLLDAHGGHRPRAERRAGAGPAPRRDRAGRLMFEGVAAQADLVRRGEVSSRELVETHAATDRAARSRAERVRRRLRRARAGRGRPRRRAPRAPGETRPLLGVPIAVKDEMDIGGEITSRGTGAIVTRAPDDSEVVKRIRAAGAIVVGKTTMPEVGLWPFTESITWGVTRNPWDTDRTPGGSSGGSAAAVAAGIVPAALAADGAGSIRIPAACCGLFGLKPHSGRVPRTPHYRDDNHWICFGALTRSVADSALMLDVIADGAFPAPAPPRRACASPSRRPSPPARAGG